MRIAIVNSLASPEGGLEHYLTALAKALSERGHRLAFLSERPGSLFQSFDGPHWVYRDGGLKNLTQWKPDIISVHSLADESIFEGLLATSPTTLSIHSHDFTCISGMRRHAFPKMQPCSKTFGPGCLVQYFPRRCGGLNPLTMFKNYKSVRNKNGLLHKLDQIFVHAPYILELLNQHKVPLSKIRLLPFGLSYPTHSRTPQITKEIHVLFMARAVKVKGFDILMRSLPDFVKLVNKSVVLHVASDGPLIAKFKESAGQIANPNIKVLFHGWANAAARQEILQQTHIHAMPSVWPEPFGLSGLEAASYGIPTVAFDVGGIGTWLKPNVNGILVTQQNAPEENFAKGLFLACESLSKLSLGATDSLKIHSMNSHVQAFETNLARLIIGGQTQRKIG